MTDDLKIGTLVRLRARGPFAQFILYEQSPLTGQSRVTDVDHLLPKDSVAIVIGSHRTHMLEKHPEKRLGTGFQVVKLQCGSFQGWNYAENLEEV